MAEAVTADVTAPINTLGSWEGDGVTVAQIADALSELRRHEQRAAVRTSVLTLVTVVRDPEIVDVTIDTVRELGARHPSRTLVLVVADTDDDPGIDAIVSVHTLPDLPVAVWLPNRLPSPGDPLLRTADRLVVDTRAIGDQPDSLAQVARLL